MNNTCAHCSATDLKEFHDVDGFIYCGPCCDYFEEMQQAMEEKDAANAAKPYVVEVNDGIGWSTVAYCDTREDANRHAGSGDYHDLGPVRVRKGGAVMVTTERRLLLVEVALHDALELAKGKGYPIQLALTRALVNVQFALDDLEQPPLPAPGQPG